METTDKIIVAVIIGLVLFFSSIAYVSYYRDIQMAKLGYEEVTVVGSASFAWQKVRQ